MGVTRILSLGVFVDQRQLKSRACMHMLDARVCDMFLHNGAFREKTFQHFYVQYEKPKN